MFWALGRALRQLRKGHISLVYQTRASSGWVLWGPHMQGHPRGFSALPFYPVISSDPYARHQFCFWGDQHQSEGLGAGCCSVTRLSRSREQTTCLSKLENMGAKRHPVTEWLSLVPRNLEAWLAYRPVTILWTMFTNWFGTKLFQLYSCFFFPHSRYILPFWQLRMSPSPLLRDHTVRSYLFKHERVTMKHIKEPQGFSLNKQNTHETGNN